MAQAFVTIEEYKKFESYVDGLPFYKAQAYEQELKDMRKRILPEVGMGATEILWSDLRAKTITKVITPNKIEVMENKTICLDYFGNVYGILEELEPRMGVVVYTRRKSGRWIQAGRPDKRGEVVLDITRRRHSIDPTF